MSKLTKREIEKLGLELADGFMENAKKHIQCLRLWSKGRKKFKEEAKKLGIEVKEDGGE